MAITKIVAYISHIHLEVGHAAQRRVHHRLHHRREVPDRRPQHVLRIVLALLVLGVILHCRELLGRAGAGDQYGIAPHVLADADGG